MVRFGMIGCGNVGQLHLLWAQRCPDMQVVAVCDIDPEASQRAGEEFQAPHWSDHRRMLAEARCDLVSIAVPHAQLAPIANDCLEAGCHVLLEKPMARHVVEAAQLLLRAEELGLLVGCAYQYRGFHTPRAIKSLIDEGRIGQIRQIIWNWHEMRSQAYYQREPWKAEWSLAGGGLVMSQLSHDIDLLRDLAGDVVSVQAQFANHAHDTDMEDTLVATMRFRNGALATINASMNQPFAGNFRTIVGTKGMIRIPEARSLSGNPGDLIELGTFETATDAAIASFEDHHRQPKIGWTRLNTNPEARRRILPSRLRKTLKHVLGRVGVRRSWSGNPPRAGHGNLLWRFAEAIKAGSPLDPELDCRGALATLEVMNALYLAGMEQRQVSLPIDGHGYLAMLDRLSSGETKLPNC
ncbi:Gfo/Idh/MocA family oxidoreductase [Aurantiacibacter sp. MUD11]|uniref:Gfo/Idh/MocA family protein n=1 Tax=Aurantiacibacter sp. MUD11 TaxID=3003265 RepID=UPI0022AB3E66|nr:Gfo/Idh/MocA family oxidoreductase [Aurantiacibacter sp. MUD11]WAT18953.1 Gfo/Idh/MocA family oxidoreductase [Aurantiacibacter sp. MUD11]